MRLAGIVTSAQGLAPFAHLCWAYRDRTDFAARAGEYLADGIASGQRVEYVGSASEDALRMELARIDDGARLPKGHRIDVRRVEEFYRVPGNGVVDPLPSVQARVAATAEAVSAGYNGFRAVVDATAIARTPEQRAALANFELLVDREMSTLPMSTLCAYDAGVLGSVAITELASLHPFVNEEATPFRLYAEPDADIAVAGEIDSSCADKFAATLKNVAATGDRAKLVIDSRELVFIDHRGTLVLADFARQTGMPVVLRDPPRSAIQAIDMLGITSVRTEVAS